MAWRVADRDRSNEDDDPSIVRHIHDLALLSGYSLNDAVFKQLVVPTVDNDDKRSTTISGLSIKEKMDHLLKQLINDKQYEKEYERFVMGMSYAKDDAVPSFDTAIDHLTKLVGFVLNN